MARESGGKVEFDPARVRETVLQIAIRDVSAEWKARAQIAAYLVDAGPQEGDL
ncbi:MAG TPA: hypothetical protein VNM87_09610 [Candidatus Udaeobacter sp.]|nr:hypothetical protein [Candidatus Udaeobacter sp.]